MRLILLVSWRFASLFLAVMTSGADTAFLVFKAEVSKPGIALGGSLTGSLAGGSCCSFA